MPIISSDTETTFKLWLNHNWYIPVNRQGYCSGTYYEGALGTVVQLVNREGSGAQALKIPRLLADTHRENAYICQLLLEEEKCVSRVFTDGRYDTKRLLVSQHNLNNILFKPIMTQFAHAEAKALDKHIIAVQFQHGRPPRFAAIGMDVDKHDNRIVFPPEVNECPVERSAIFDQVVAASNSLAEDWNSPVVVAPHTTAEGQVFKISDAFESKVDQDVWYVGIPCVAYSWGAITLQEVMLLGANSEWAIREKLLLVTNLLSGILSLHWRGLLHTDIRPSNAMCIGDAADPDNYYLIDYAAYNLSACHCYSGEAGAGKPAERENRILGPTIGRERSSPFYAPERRWSLEKESGDVAIILRDDSEKLRVLVGWSRECMENGKVRRELKEKIQGFTFSDDDAMETIKQQAANEYDLLLPRDRIQLGDYIFDIEAASSLQDKQIFLCNRDHWKIYHGKIVVADSQDFDKGWISISKLVEIRQWSGATDIFGMGALFLYVLFSKGSNHGEASIVSSELAFGRMLNQFESVSCFQRVWPIMASLCLQLNACFDAGMKDADIKESPFDIAGLGRMSGILSHNSRDTLDDTARNMATYFTHTITETRYILESMKYNYVYFIYSMMFILLCVHKRNTLRESIESVLTPVKDYCGVRFPGYETDVDLVLPFCESRIEPPLPEGGVPRSSAGLAKKYLGRFLKIVDSDVLKSCKFDDIGVFASDSSHSIVLGEKYFELKRNYDSLFSDHESMTRDHESMLGDFDRVTLESAEVNQRLDALADKHQELIRNLDRIASEKSTIIQKHSALERSHEDLVERCANLAREKEILEDTVRSMAESDSIGRDDLDGATQFGLHSDADDSAIRDYASAYDAVDSLLRALEETRERPIVGGYSAETIAFVKDVLTSIVKKEQ